MPESSSSATDASGIMSPARKRAEARKQKIMSQGGDRLAKITGAMKAGSGATDEIYDSTPRSLPSANATSTSTSASPVSHSADPDETIPTVTYNVNGRKSTHASSSQQRKPTMSKSKSTQFEPRFPIGGFGESSSFPESQTPDPSLLPPGLLGEDANDSSGDPLADMLKAFGAANSFGREGSRSGANNPFLQQLLAAQQQTQQPQNAMGQGLLPSQTWIEKLFPILHIMVIIALLFSTLFFWEPSARSFGFSAAKSESSSWAKLAAESQEKKGVGSFLRGNFSNTDRLGSVPIFWMFVTVELALQATRLFFARFAAAPPRGLMMTLISSLPPPYSTTLLTFGKYYSLLNSFIDDFCILLFALGCVIIWSTWTQTGGKSNGLEQFVSA